MLRILADNHHLTMALDYLAFFAYFLNRRSDLHNKSFLSHKDAFSAVYFERHVMRPRVKS